MYAALGHYAGSLIFLCCFPLAGFAFFKGGVPERFGACALLVAWTLSQVVETGRAYDSLTWVISIPVLAIEFALSMTFLALALRYGSLWLGAAMVAQGAQLGFHAFYISGDAFGWRVFAVASNAISGLLLVLMLAAILSSATRRHGHAGRSPPPAYG